MDLVISTPGARVVTVSSLAHRAGSVVPATVEQVGSDYSRVRAYGRSKPANLLFAYDLQRRFTERGIPAGSLAAHPGEWPTADPYPSGTAARFGPAYPYGDAT